MAPKTLDMTKLPIEKRILDTPNLEEIAEVLNSQLRDDFVEACAHVVDCPDLTQAPFHLAAKGLCGNESILDIGGPAYLLPLPNKEKIYDLRSIPKLVGDDKSFIVGAGNGPWPFAIVNSEYIANTVVDAEKVIVPASRMAILENGESKLIYQSSNESRFCLLLNVFSSRGESGKVLKVHCKNRKGKLDFIGTIREKLKSAYPDKVIGFGGVFVLLEGKARQHVMPDFPDKPINSEDDLNEWLKFYEVPAPLTALGTFVSKDPGGLDLRAQHFHSFGKSEGGHFYHDTTPDHVEYLAYFALGKVLYRVDRPPVPHKFGSV